MSVWWNWILSTNSNRTRKPEAVQRFCSQVYAAVVVVVGVVFVFVFPNQMKKNYPINFTETRVLLYFEHETIVFSSSLYHTVDKSCVCTCCIDCAVSKWNTTLWRLRTFTTYFYYIKFRKMCICRFSHTNTHTHSRAIYKKKNLFRNLNGLKSTHSAIETRSSVCRIYASQQTNIVVLFSPIQFSFGLSIC